MCINVREQKSPGYSVANGRFVSAISSFLIPRRKAERSPTVAECCSRWLAQRRQRVKESTYVKYVSIFQNHVFPYFGQMCVTALSAEQINLFIEKLSEENKLSPKTVRDVITLFKSSIEDSFPAIGSKVFTKEVMIPKSNKREIRVLDKEEERKLMHFLLENPSESHLGIFLALLTGMRIGEVCALRWRDISLEHKTVQVNATIQRIKNTDTQGEDRTKLLMDSPKSSSSVRCIPLTAFAVNLLLQNHCENPEAFVLTASEHRLIEPRVLQYHLAKCTAACGLTDVHFHTLRHTFATRCAEVDFEIKSLSEVLGHSNPNITLERYVHPSLELKRTNMEKLSAIGY